MGAYDGPAELSWYANPSTVLLWTEVETRIDETADGWDVRVRGDAETIAAMRLFGAPVTLEFPDGSAFDVELAPGRPPITSDPPTDAELHECGGWVEVAAFADMPSVVDVTFTSAAAGRATDPSNP